MPLRLGAGGGRLRFLWVLQNDNVASAIVGATRPDQLDENVKAVGITLDPETLRAIDEVLADVIVSDPKKTESPATRP